MRRALTGLLLGASLVGAARAEAPPTPALESTDPGIALVAPGIESPGTLQGTAWVTTDVDYETVVRPGLSWSASRRLRVHADLALPQDPLGLSAVGQVRGGATIGLVNPTGRGRSLGLATELAWAPAIYPGTHLRALSGRALLTGSVRRSTIGGTLNLGVEGTTQGRASVVAGAGVQKRLLDQTHVIAEVHGGWMFSPWTELEPLHGWLGLAVGSRRGVAAVVFSGLEVDPRGWGLSWEAGIGLSARRQGLAPDLDRDRIRNGRDECVRAPEDRDAHSDEDGCPDPDDDGDRVPDVSDACPDEAEDLDGYLDGDGCPEWDNDADGVIDPEDDCPLDPGPAAAGGCPDFDEDRVPDGRDRCETRPGPEATGGCPDRDGDGVADLRDACPDTPAGADSVPLVSFGCPPRAVVEGGRIRIDERIHFAFGTAELLESSRAPLRSVARLLLESTHLALVEIGGHTDAVGDEDANLDLSQDRAEAVLEFLVGEGVPPERLEARGYGESRPVDSNDTEWGRAGNRRVEFLVLRAE